MVNGLPWYNPRIHSIFFFSIDTSVKAGITTSVLLLSLVHVIFMIKFKWLRVSKLRFISVLDKLYIHRLTVSNSLFITEKCVKPDVLVTRVLTNSYRG